MRYLVALTTLLLSFLSYNLQAQCGATSVTVTPQPILICEGNSTVISFSSTGTCATTYEYEVLSGVTVLQPWSTTSTFNASPITTTTFTVNARCSACPGIVVTTTFDVEVVEEPTITGNLVVCPGTSTTLTASGSTGVFEWWDADPGVTQLSPNGVYTTPALASDATYWIQAAGTIPGAGGSIMITECGLDGAIGGTGSEDYLEISNLYTTPINTTGWVCAVSSSYSNINLSNPVLWNLPNSFPSCAVETRTDDNGAANYWGNNIYWNSTSNSWAIVIDNLGNVVDFLAWGWTAAELATFNQVINGFNITLGPEWIGNGCPLPCGSAGGVQYSFARTGSTDNNNAGDFVCQPTSVDLLNPGLSCGWTSNLNCSWPVTVVVDLPPTASNPATINVECSADVPLPDVNVVTDENDDITLIPIVTFISDVSDGLFCPETITRTYRVTDGCGSFIDVIQLIVIQDITPPTLVAPPANITVECIGDVPAMINLTWNDNCDGTGSIAGIDGALTDPCGGTITRTWTYSDGCNNTVTVTQIITVDDTTLPTASNPAAQIGVPPVPNPLVVIDEADNCGTPTVTFISDVSDNGICPEIVTRTYRITDACGNYIDVTQTFTIGDLIFPTASDPLPINVECIGDVPAPNPLVVTDENDNGTTPIVTWEDDTSDNGSCPETITRRYRVTDDCGNFIFVTQIITVIDVTAPILAAPPANITVECLGDVPAMINLSYTDNCDPSGSVTGVDSPPTGLCGGTVTRTWTITDNCGNTTTVSQTITIDDTTPPTAANPANTTVPGGPAPAVDINVVIGEMDNCSIPVVTFVSEVSDNNPCPETITRTYAVTDACGNSIFVTHTIIITDPFPPTADPIPAAAYNCIADVLPPNILIVTNEMDNNGIPTVTWISDVSDNGSCPEIIQRTYRVTDLCGTFIDLVQIITINVTTGPTAPANASSTVECLSLATQPISPAVVDQCGNNLIPVVTENTSPACEGNKIYTFTYTDCAGNTSVYVYTYTIDIVTSPIVPANATSIVECLSSIVAPTAPIVSDACGNNIVPVETENSDPICEGDKIYTFTYTDCGGNVSIYTSTFTIDLTSSPIVPPNHLDIVQCVSDIFVPTAPVVTDYCGNILLPTMTENATPICVGDKVYTFTFTDCAGNISIFTYTFSVNDNINPTASNPIAISVPSPLDVPASNILVVTDEADNCTLNPTVVWISDVSDGNVCNGEIITRTYSITDDCGNSILVTQLITILATYPVIDAGPDQTICDGDQVILSAINPSNATITWDNSVIDNQSFSPTITNTYMVSADNLGCISTDVVTVTVVPIPQVSFTADVLSGCAPLLVTFTNTTPGMTNCIWDINGSQLNGCSDVTYEFTDPGTYDITLTTSDNPSCVGTVTYTDYIYIEADPNASFIPSTNTIDNINSEMSFTNTTSGATNYVWNLGDGATSTIESPTHTYPTESAGSFLVEMIAYSALGCTDTAWTTITLNEEVIYYVPNTFTPDDDDYNPTFKPVFTAGYDPFDFTFLIFNRWGEVIFESHNSSIGWDGTYGGKLMQDGTYIWTIEFKTTSTDKRVSINGHLNLIR